MSFMMTSKPALRTAAASAAGAKCGPRGSEMGGKSKQSFMIKVKSRIQESKVRIKSYKCFLGIIIYIMYALSLLIVARLQ
jgi:hypothetical protein